MPTARCPNKLCLPCHGPRLSTLLETADTLVFLRAASSGYEPHETIPLPADCTERTVALLIASKSADVLICGGITRDIRDLLEEEGVCVLSWVCGHAACVLAAYMGGTLNRHHMPGCGKRGQQHGRRRRGKGSLANSTPSPKSGG